jgi:hypothetical protein
LTILCPKCKTQVTVPPLPGGAGTPRPWYTSRGWQAVLVATGLALAGLVASLVLLLTAERSESFGDAPESDGDGPAVAYLGAALVLECDAPVSVPGGYFRLVRPGGRLEVAGRDPLPVEARGEENPWPASLEGTADPPPSRRVNGVRFLVTIPSQGGLAGRRAMLRVAGEMEYLHQTEAGAPLTVRRQPVGRARDVFLAADEAHAARARAPRSRSVLRGLVFGFAMALLALGVGAYVFGQKVVTLMCPRCNRAAPAYYSHEKGAYRLSPCPHRNAGPTARDR